MAPLTTVQARNSPQPLTYGGLLYLRERRSNVTTDVSPEPVILQIQDIVIDLEEGGDDFVDIDDMLLDELGLEELDLRATATVELATTATATAATTVTMTATATAATTTARTVAATAAATAATTQPRKRGRPKGSKDKELRKRQKATVVILRPLARHLYIASKALGSLKCIGFDISSNGWREKIG